MKETEVGHDLELELDLESDLDLDLDEGSGGGPWEKVWDDTHQVTLIHESLTPPPLPPILFYCTLTL